MNASASKRTVRTAAAEKDMTTAFIRKETGS